MKKQLIGLLSVLVFSFIGAALALADSGGVPMEQQAPLPVGTVITTQNWQQYKDYMPLYMEVLFSGEYAFKLAPDQQVVVGPLTIKPYPKEYVKNTEKYSGQVGLKVQDDGGTVIQNYTAGLPFPHPTNPNIADKLLWDLWYRYLPRVEINKVINLLLIDKYHQVFTEVLFNDYMRLSHVSEPGLPIFTPEAKDIDIALYLEVTEPEQSKYTVSLILYFVDPTRIQEIWSFVPSLRRPLRLSASARCAPAAGSDSTTEDQKSGFNMLLSETYGTLVAHKMLLTSNNFAPAYPAPISFANANDLHLWGVDKGIAWPPPPSKWELGETWVVEGRRVKEKLPGYCYGIRRMYIDAQDFKLEGEALYDMGNKLWKIEWLDSRLHPNGYGDVFESGSGNYMSNVIDLQNSHMSVADETNGTNLTNTEVEPALWSVARYGSPTGLLEIMK
jgi:uncharacterized protein DUF1329